MLKYCIAGSVELFTISLENNLFLETLACASSFLFEKAQM